MPTFTVSEEERRQARKPHDLFMISLGGQLLLGPAAIFLEIGRIALLLPLSFSLLFFLWSWRESKRCEQGKSWFVASHWRLALSRYRLLYIGYAITTLFLLLGWLLSVTIDPHSPQKFLAVALTRIGVMPTIIMVLVTLVMENMGLNMAQQGELPQKMVDRYPPP
ncbi:MAG: hypothetical protein HQL48_07405 [Gammaproteobacteria bacterium]|nr:hypothetical protein [Gammaproteobacteria bacterium]